MEERGLLTGWGYKSGKLCVVGGLGAGHALWYIQLQKGHRHIGTVPQGVISSSCVNKVVKGGTCGQVWSFFGGSLDAGTLGGARVVVLRILSTAAGPASHCGLGPGARVAVVFEQQGLRPYSGREAEGLVGGGHW